MFKEKVKEIDFVSIFLEVMLVVKVYGVDLIVSVMYFEDGIVIDLLKFIKENDEFKMIFFMLVLSEN